MVARLLARPSRLAAFVLLSIAVVTSTLVAAAIARDTDVNELFFAGTRAPLVQVMIDTLGPQRTALVLYLIQRSFDALVVATAFSPVFFWLLGSTAVHASARLAGIRRPFAPLLLFFAFASAITTIPANAAALVLGVGKGIGPQVATLISYVCLGWLLFLAYRAIKAHYAVTGERAVRILIVAVVVFYLVPLALIAVAAVAIVIAAVVLNYI